MNAGQRARRQIGLVKDVGDIIDEPDATRATTPYDLVVDADAGALRLWDTPGFSDSFRLARRLRIVHTPRNGSWLNMAEIELSVLARQCLRRRFDSVTHMQTAIALWQNARNTAECGARWRFTTTQARIQLQSLYPQPDVLG